MRDIVNDLASIAHPWEFYGMNDYERCFFCGKDRPPHQSQPADEHEPECVWLRARTLIEAAQCP